MELDPALLAQLVETFQGELDDQISVITDALIALEKRQSAEEQTDLLHGMFRAAHNIKGAARGIEVTEVADVAHQLESVFTVLKQNPSRPNASTVDAALASLDVMKSAMTSFREKKGQQTPGVGEVIERLKTCLTDTSADSAAPCLASVSQRSAVVKPSVSPQEPVASTTSPEVPVEHGGSERPDVKRADETTPDAPPTKVLSSNATDAIRVRIDKLSRISVMSEDLLVTQAGIKDHQKGIQNLVMDLQGLKKRFKLFRSNMQRLRSEGEEDRVGDRASQELNEILKRAEALSKDMRQSGRRMDAIANALQVDARMLRLVPVMSVLQPLVRAGRDVARELGKKVDVVINGGDIEIDKAVIDRMRDPFMHLLRNAIDHGLEVPATREANGKPAAGKVLISVARVGGQIEIVVEDDGHGIDLNVLKAVAVDRGVIRPEACAELSGAATLDLMFQPGFTVKHEVSEISGRGVGLDVVKSNIQELKGQVSVESTLGKGTRFIVTLPLTLSTERGLQVVVGQTRLIVPSASVQRIIEINTDDVMRIQGDHAVLVDGVTVPVRDLAEMLHVPKGEAARDGARSALVVRRGTRTVAFLVDEIEGEYEIVLKPLRYPLVSVRYVSGATLTRHGQVVMVLAVPDLLDQSVSCTYQPSRSANAEEKQDVAPPHILVVDDSITTRTLERNILEINGYQVSVAMNGQEAWQLVKEKHFDLVVSDVEMPEMDGFSLTEHIRGDAEFEELPVILVTSLASENHQRRGLAAGANAYIVKGTFETQVLLDAVQRFV